jgi:hypothetical protein
LEDHVLQFKNCGAAFSKDFPPSLWHFLL